MANKKISELLVATSSLATDDLVIRRGSDNFKIASGLLTSTNNPVISSSISGITQTFTKQDSSTYTNEIVSASFAVSASYALSASVEVRKEVSSSYADTASVSLRNSGVLSNGALVDVFSYDGSTDVVVDISTYSSSAATSLTNISSSLTSTNQTISSSVASLSGSASDARNLLVADLDTISSSASTARDVLASQVSGAFSSDSSSFSTRITTLEEFSSSLDATYTTNTELNEATASLSGSASDARNQLTSDYLAADTTLSSSVSTERVKYVKEVTSIGDNLISVTKGDGSTNNITIVTSSFVKTVNGNGPDGVGNVAVALASTSTGLSSSFPTSPDDADVYIISGETIEARTSSNGEIFIYSTASSQWYQITSPDQTSNDVRYVQVAGDTMTGALTLPSNPTAALHAATKQYVDNVTTVGTDGQTIRFEGTTPIANSVLYNSGSQIAIGNTSPQPQDTLTVTNGGDTRVRIGRTTLSPDRDYVEIRSTSATGSFIVNNEWLVISASAASGGGGQGDILIHPSGGATYHSNTQIKDIANPTDSQDAATKDYVDNLSGSLISDYVKKIGDTMTGKLTVDVSGDGILDDELPLSIKGAGIIIGDRNGDRRTFTNGTVLQFRDYGITHWNIKSSGSFEISQNSGGANDGYYMKFPILTKNVEFNNGILQNIANPTGSQDAATKNYVDTLSGSASDARDALTGSFLLRAGDTMTGALSITNNSDFGLEIQRPAGSEPGLVFNQAGISRTILSQNSTNPFGLSIYDSTKTILRPIQVANPTATQDAATKNYVDNLLTSTITAAVWDPTNTAQTVPNTSKITFNYNSSRQTTTNDASQASWSTTNNEFALSEGTWHIMFDFRKDTQTTTAVRYWQIQYKTTAGTGTGGTLIDASPTINNALSGEEKIHMESFLTVPAGSTYYAYAWIASGGPVTGRFTKMLCKRIG